MDGVQIDYAQPSAGESSPLPALEPERAVSHATPSAEIELPICCICLEDASKDLGAESILLVGVCACKTEGIHTSCCERLINSKQRRSLPLAQRLACARSAHLVPPGAIGREAVCTVE